MHMCMRVGVDLNLYKPGFGVLNPFQNDEILDETKLKAFADHKSNNKSDIYVFDME